MSCRRPYRPSRIPRPIRCDAEDREEMSLYDDSPYNEYNPDIFFEADECSYQDDVSGASAVETFDPDNPDHIYNPVFGPGHYPEPGEEVTGLGTPHAFWRHGRNDWGTSFVTQDFYTDNQLTDHPGMLFQGHIPPEEPSHALFDQYVDIGGQACDDMERHIAQHPGSSFRRFPISRTPAWVQEEGGAMRMAFPGEPGYAPIRNVMLEESDVSPWVPIIYNPTFGPVGFPDPSEPSTGFGGPFSDNLEMPWGPDSYVCSDFDDYAHDSGEHPGMRFEATIPLEEPGDDDFDAFLEAQDRLFALASNVERDRGLRFDRSHPFWRGFAAPKFSDSGKYEGPDC